MDKDLLNFIKSQRVVVIATTDSDSEPWVVNIFYGANDNGRLYFISDKKRIHSKHIINNPNVAFSIVWFNPDDHEDRKGIQGKGVCKIAETDEEIKEGVRLHNERFPKFKADITFKWAKLVGYKVWYIDPTYIKYWDDELFGEGKPKEYKF